MTLQDNKPGTGRCDGTEDNLVRIYGCSGEESDTFEDRASGDVTSCFNLVCTVLTTEERADATLFTISFDELDRPD